MVAFLVEKGVKEPFLIAAPSAVVAHWEREVATWLPGLIFVAYKGNADKRADIFEAEVSSIALSETHNALYLKHK